METLYALALSPWGRVLLLSLIIGLSMQGVKATTPPQTWLRAMLPAIPVLIGGICGLIPGVLVGEATVLLGAGAGALSSSMVELWGRYKDQAMVVALQQLPGNQGAPKPPAP